MKLTLPFSPLPTELEVAEMVRKPVHEAVGKLHVHGFEAAEQESDGATQTGSYSGW
jgi:hypothetical protein